MKLLEPSAYTTKPFLLEITSYPLSWALFWYSFAVCHKANKIHICLLYFRCSRVILVWDLPVVGMVKFACWEKTNRNKWDLECMLSETLKAALCFIIAFELNHTMPFVPAINHWILHWLTNIIQFFFQSNSCVQSSLHFNHCKQGGNWTKKCCN